MTPKKKTKIWYVVVVDDADPTGDEEAYAHLFRTKGDAVMYVRKCRKGDERNAGSFFNVKAGIAWSNSDNERGVSYQIGCEEI